MRVWGFDIRAAAFGLGLFAISPLMATDGWAARPHTNATHPATKGPTAKGPVAKAPAAKRPVSGVNVIVPSKSSDHVIPIKASTSAAVYHFGNRKGLPLVNAMARVRQGGGNKQDLVKGGKARYYSHGGGYSTLQCVPFARAASGIEIKGNAANWWDSASGVYARGQAPESGSVLNFRSTGNMRLGHVAVVTRVIDSREIEIDHANWTSAGASKGGISRAIPVIDVSEDNDWSSVRVGLGHTGGYGSVYPTFGFIYDRPDNGMMASNTHNAKPLNSAIHYDEVAEAPSRSIR